jgi:NAD(P)-dependent dehydrogenase (short-subunit alcohol dehydrogenase family)
VFDPDVDPAVSGVEVFLPVGQLAVGGFAVGHDHFGVALVAVVGHERPVVELVFEAGVAVGGAVVAVAGLRFAGGRHRRRLALYGSSKAALALLTKAWAAEFGPSGVRVNAVSASPTRTGGTERFGPGLDRMAAAAPAGRPAAPEEIAAAISYLASNEASFVQGAVLDVDGGRNAT